MKRKNERKILPIVVCDRSQPVVKSSAAAQPGCHLKNGSPARVFRCPALRTLPVFSQESWRKYLIGILVRIFYLEPQPAMNGKLVRQFDHSHSSLVNFSLFVSNQNSTIDNNFTTSSSIIHTTLTIHNKGWSLTAIFESFQSFIDLRKSCPLLEQSLSNRKMSSL